MALDLPAYDAVARSTTAGPVVLGWAGTAGGIHYLNALALVLRRLAQEHAILVRVVSGGYRAVLLPGVPLDARPWQPDTALAAMASFDIGLLPLDDSDFERAKFPFKLLQYLALRIPVVSARVGVASDLLDPSQLAASPDEWYAALSRLIGDSVERRRLGDAGRQIVEADYTLERVGPLLVDGLLSTAR
jgi:glycosyltransferase involved in cell wall biosynthesis